jgi:hypothetical protein
MALAKLRRLRYRSDYPLRLFLAATGRGSAAEDGLCGREDRKRGAAGVQRQPSRVVWPMGASRCPRCGYPERDSPRRRARIN